MCVCVGGGGGGVRTDQTDDIDTKELGHGRNTRYSTMTAIITRNMSSTGTERCNSIVFSSKTTSCNHSS